ncbi:MAG: glycosyltransferase [Thermoleophilia bacterium]
MIRPLRVEWVGTYERDYPRTRVLVAGLRSLGVVVDERHRPVWERTTHKAGGFLSPGSLVKAGGSYAAAWAGLAVERRPGGSPHVVVAGYPAQPDAVPAWVVARRHRALLVVDMMISLTDTLAGDRARVGRMGGAVLAGIDRTTLRLADLVLCDTHANANFMAMRFGVPRDRLVVAPVGAEPDAFPPTPQPSGPLHVLWYGKLAPMHGLEVIVSAARGEGVPPVRLIGSGQLDSWLAHEIRRDPPKGLQHVPWVPYEALAGEIASSGVVLGVFGQSDKASRVIPNKVFQAMAAARPVVTADTPGIREALVHGENALLVPAGDPDALAEALRTLAGDPALRERLGTAARRRYEEMGTPQAVAAPLLDAIRRSRP